jgi:hypothetical protein
MRVVDKRWTRKFLGLHVTGVGFPRPANVTTISGPHPWKWWRKYEYYKRSRRASS